jgi:electron transport complex protein RnfE
VVSAIHKFIPAYAKLPVYLLIITGFVSIIQMLMQAFFPIVVDMLGAHLAALAVSAVIYRDAEEIADHNGEWHSIKAALTTGIFLTVIMVICALIREPLGNATLWGKEIAFLANYKVSALASAFGAYIVLACILAAIKKLTGAEEHLEGEEHE